jgi:hypothetical protein
MADLTVSYEKLRAYCEGSNMYRMFEEGREIRLVFEPNFVEASYHGSGAKSYIHLVREGERARLVKFEVEDAEGERREVDLEAAGPSLEVWLASVER